MLPKAESAKRKAQLCAIADALPGSAARERHDSLAFLVAGKVFAYYLDDHHGDGITSVCAKVLAGDNQRLVAASTRKFYLPAYIGPRGWVGLRLDRPSVDWNEVRELVQGSYRLVAPPRLVRRMRDGETAEGRDRDARERSMP